VSAPREERLLKRNKGGADEVRGQTVALFRIGGRGYLPPVLPPPMLEILTRVSRDVETQLRASAPNPQAWTEAVQYVVFGDDIAEILASTFGVHRGALRSFRLARESEYVARDAKLRRDVDLTWATFAEHLRFVDPRDWDEHPLRCPLVCETEWGDPSSPLANYRRVVDDFDELVKARAPLKVMTYGFHLADSPGAAELEAAFVRILGESDSPVRSSYLFLGVPWNFAHYVADGAWEFRSHIFGGTRLAPTATQSVGASP
jgi:hypothetical protein